ncbi:MAG TPA: 16S rRNA (cytidine(1402)-2'-O)-methyltransferase [Ignavibacteriaceae bacterium]|jgi:16S rRNA (cytidine1402-2'-O)-methyltransferase|nr:MAG: Ribosomal RNA small subunit methyltransferase I [Ignavibacteria bacterium ADurb.Bin266]OQY74853.1 MAG: 16S rRNA (cytidine(1402)-2'-O)-methyltransferase [Ignavibacteriales bacterium UTCHB2]HQF42108.1 16S rRNA (cytidine(1402)-2'-O)-methyltransferase [Ignavibacteriaceae bacterium]HQI42148.1 16S rRNA (cytidine(1402)-2'-O)-methyltransferase [Ignavibacteriaceae bacterium]
MKLYIVSTPIGNLKDITLRALEVLKEVDFILCEDTRVSANLLNHFGIKKELISLNAVNETKKIQSIITRLNSNQAAALISDAGTPLISDPGVRLVSACIENDIEIVPIPGPSALLAALSMSGLPTDSFVFEGFLPQKKGRQTKLKQLALEERTIVLYESMYRIEKLLNELNEFLPERFLVVCREITKKFEETWRGNAKDILSDFPDKVVKGEFVIVIAPKNWKSKNLN